MKTTRIYSLLLALSLLAAATGETFAIWNTSFNGTRDQVRTACAQVGGQVLEGSNMTTCFNSKNDTGVTCGDDGKCNGSGPGPSPRVRLGTLDVVGIVLGLSRARAPQGVPESLTSGNSGGSPAPTGAETGAGGGWSAGDIGQWHANPGGSIGGGIFVAN